ncbi:DUF2975 domain-containing protein [Micromonospora sp. NPDC050686]|uniref:DUF2975 domain-containing protein n=1 Tax=Micromonospora sp. NPDC050686 TaxID=3154631 RepID=UPI0033F102AE
MNASVKVSVRLLIGLIGAAAAAVLVFGVWPTVLGPSGLELGRGLAPMPAPQPVQTVAVLPDDGFAARWQAAAPDTHQVFPWQDTSDGTRDAITGLPPVELATPSMVLSILEPSWLDRLSLAGPELAAQALILAVLWLLRRIVRTVPAAEVFADANARRIVLIGLLVAVGGSAVQLLGYAADRAVVARSAAAGVVDAAFSFSFVPLAIGAIVLLLAEVFRQGVRLRADVDGLV